MTLPVATLIRVVEDKMSMWEQDHVAIQHLRKAAADLVWVLNRIDDHTAPIYLERVAQTVLHPLHCDDTLCRYALTDVIGRLLPPKPQKPWDTMTESEKDILCYREVIERDAYLVVPCHMDTWFDRLAKIIHLPPALKSNWFGEFPKEAPKELFKLIDRLSLDEKMDFLVNLLCYRCMLYPLA